MSGIELQGLTKTYAKGVAALQPTDLAVAPGEYLAVVGPSGSGKSTLLRLIAGLESPTAGQLRIDGRPANDLPPWNRGVAMVFQDQPPYPHLDVRGNLAFSLRASGAGRSEVRSRVAEVAALLKLDTLLDRSPRALSGGERRRVVLGRAIARRPRILLLDEPLSGLDAPLRASTRSLLAGLHQQFGMTTLHVTHDQAEALALGQRVAVVGGGRLIQCSDPVELYNRPASIAVARFIGDPPMNLLPADWLPDPQVPRLRLLGRDYPVPDPPAREALAALPRPRPIVLGLRSEHLEIVNTCDPGPPTIPAVVRRREVAGADAIVEALAGDTLIRLRVSTQVGIKPGLMVKLRPRLAASCWFDPATGHRLPVAARPMPAG